MRKILLASAVICFAYPAGAASVHLLRGTDSETVTVPVRSATAVRGGGHPVDSPPAPKSDARPVRYAVAGGGFLWLVDAGSGRITACSLRGTGYVGQNRIHCSAARLR